MSEHRITWWVYAWDTAGNVEKMRHRASMRGEWAYDVSCSCGWESRTGGGVRRYLQEQVRWHKAEVAA